MWGFAEATLFFIVPDVILTYIAITNLRKALKASLFALAGALLGGLLMYYWGAIHPQAALSVVEQVPAIDNEMITKVEEDLAERGLLAMILGPIQGIPYKIYAVQAADANIHVLSFFFASIPARYLRFFLSSLLAGLAGKYLLRNRSRSIRYSALTLFWILFYTFYFSVYPF